MNTERQRHPAKLFLLSLSVLFLASACTTDHGRFKVVALKKVDFKDYDSKTAKTIRGVKASEKRHEVILFPITDASLEGAVTDLCDKNYGDFVTNVDLWERWWTVCYFLPWYTQYAYYAKGDVVQLNNQLAPGTTSSSSENTQEPRD